MRDEINFSGLWLVSFPTTALDINLTLKLFRTIVCLACFPSFPLALIIYSALKINLTALVLLRDEINCSFPSTELDSILILFRDEMNCCTVTSLLPESEDSLDSDTQFRTLTLLVDFLFLSH